MLEYNWLCMFQFMFSMPVSTYSLIADDRCGMYQKTSRPS